MSEEYIIYCDESDKKGKYYSNFYGGAILLGKELEHINSILQSKKQSLNLNNEVKWGRVTPQYLSKYVELVDTFFDLIYQGKVKVRIMFTQNIFSAHSLTNYHREHEYFLLYYQFLKNAFGLQYSSTGAKKVKIRVYLDQLPDTEKKVKVFKSYLHRLSNNSEFRNAGVVLPRDQISDVDSKEHLVLQCLDIILGSISFRLNNKHKEKPVGSSRRGSRTIAKERLYKHIYNHIRNIFPRFNIGCTNSIQGKPENSWLHSYRHWLFKPKNRTVDLSKGKKRRKK